MGNPAHTGGPRTLKNIPIREQKSGTHAAKERVPTTFMPEETVKMMALCWYSELTRAVYHAGLLFFPVICWNNSRGHLAMRVPCAYEGPHHTGTDNYSLPGWQIALELVGGFQDLLSEDTRVSRGLDAK